MSQPRMSIPGATYLVTRTTVMSLFLLTPSKTVNQIMKYCLAWAARGRGILIHAVSVESNHFHMVVTDTQGRLSDFMQELNRSAARCLLAYYRERFPNRRLESIWSSAQPFSAIHLLTPNAVLDKIVYTLTNPVKDGLVRDYRDWSGLNTRPSDWQKGEQVVERPAFYFKNTPQELTYRISAPPQLGDSVEQAIVTTELHIRDAQRQAAIELAAQRRSIVGEKVVAGANPFDAPTTPRPIGRLKPTVASGGDAEALRLGTQALKLFRLAYRAAWNQFKAGLTTIFPGGTLLMCTRFGQRCTPLDTGWCVLAK
jgi:REP element-mobilizing transposase RayT